MSVKYEVTTKMVWSEDLSPKQGSPRRLVVETSAFNDMDIRYEYPGQEDQLIELDETAWHALYAMMGEVKS